jgi:hypothetical protein
MLSGRFGGLFTDLQQCIRQAVNQDSPFSTGKQSKLTKKAHYEGLDYMLEVGLAITRHTNKEFQVQVSLVANGVDFSYAKVAIRLEGRDYIVDLIEDPQNISSFGFRCTGVLSLTEVKQPVKLSAKLL